MVDLYMSKYGMSVIPGYSGYIMSLLPIFNNVLWVICLYQVMNARMRFA